MSSYDAAIIDTATVEHPRRLELPRGTRYLHIEAIVWCRLHHTDGEIPRHMPGEPDVEAAIEALVDVGSWKVIPSGWRIVDFLDTQMSAERIEAKRASSRERWDRFVSGGQRVSKRVSNDSDLTRPDPTRKGRKGGRGADGSRGARPEGATALPPLPRELSPTDILNAMTLPAGESCVQCGAAFALTSQWPSEPAPRIGNWTKVRRHVDHEKLGRPAPCWVAFKRDLIDRNDWDGCEAGQPMLEALLDDEGFCRAGDPRGCGGKPAWLALSEDDPGPPDPPAPPPLSPEEAERLNRGLLADPESAGVVKRAAAKALARLGVEPPVADVVICAEYVGHQRWHRRVGEGWVCDACDGSADMPQRPRLAASS